MNCSQCNSLMHPKAIADYHFLESGLKNIYIENAQVWVCSQCGSQDLEIPDPNGLNLAISETNRSQSHQDEKGDYAAIYEKKWFLLKKSGAYKHEKQ